MIFFYKTHSSNHPTLKNQKALRTKTRMKKDSIVGEYTGRLFFNADEPNNPGNKICSFLIRDENKNHVEISIDGDYNGNELRWTNDFRTDIMDLKSTKNNRYLINCEWLVLVIEHEPRVFCRLARDVEKGEEILIDYGDEYWKAQLSTHETNTTK